jgi:hypothetical protein
VTKYALAFTYGYKHIRLHFYNSNYDEVGILPLFAPSMPLKRVLAIGS